jgi:UDPglucose 6-dehydrogenase
VRLTVIGCGYVGLVTGACLAAAGHEVFCTDIDDKRIDQLKAGKVPIYEEHLDEVLKRAAADKKIFYSSDAAEAIRAGDVIFICVGTPPKDSGEADLSAIDHVARQVATEARTPKLVVEKSTVPALTGVQLQKALAAYSAGNGPKFQVASNPEFLREGTAVGDFFHPDRIVVGV